MIRKSIQSKKVARMKNVLVTGACGFIGSNLCHSLLLDGYSVVGVDAFTENYGREIKKRNSIFLEEFDSFKLLECDLLNIDLAKLVHGADVIFHLAGQPSVHNSWGKDFEIYSKRNVILTQKLLRAAQEAKTPRFVNSSSSSVYGRVVSTPTKESDEKSPISPYGVTKLAAENLVTLYGSEFGMSTVSLRYFTVYGPRQRPDMAFNRLIQAGQTGKIFPLHGDGSQIRDFTFVGDVVEANKLAAFSEVSPGSVFNIGGGSPISLNQVISSLEEIMDLKIEIEESPLGPGNPMVTTADCTAAGSELGWKPKMNIYEGLKAQVLWQLDQA
jgi:UDP-glucuronate 4-epimerase